MQIKHSLSKLYVYGSCTGLLEVKKNGTLETFNRELLVTNRQRGSPSVGSPKWHQTRLLSVQCEPCAPSVLRGTALWLLELFWPILCQHELMHLSATVDKIFRSTFAVVNNQVTCSRVSSIFLAHCSFPTTTILPCLSSCCSESCKRRRDSGHTGGPSWMADPTEPMIRRLC